eukprot:6783968-Prymnesium_polylepis.1
MGGTALMGRLGGTGRWDGCGAACIGARDGCTSSLPMPSPSAGGSTYLVASQRMGCAATKGAQQGRGGDGAVVSRWGAAVANGCGCLLYTSPSPRDAHES